MLSRLIQLPLGFSGGGFKLLLVDFSFTFEGLVVGGVEVLYLAMEHVLQPQYGAC